MWNSLRLIVIITNLGIWQPYPTLESPYRVHLVLRDLTGRVDCVLLKRSSILSAEQYDHTVTDRDRSLKGMRSLKKKNCFSHANLIAVRQRSQRLPWASCPSHEDGFFAYIRGPCTTAVDRGVGNDVCRHVMRLHKTPTDTLSGTTKRLTCGMGESIRTLLLNLIWGVQF